MNENLQKALDESVKLQSHYAGLLNAYDGGSRMEFTSSQGWIDRLKVCGTLPASSEEPNCDGPDLRTVAKAAVSALLSYQYGNSAPDLAESVADSLEAALAADVS